MSLSMRAISLIALHDSRLAWKGSPVSGNRSPLIGSSGGVTEDTPTKNSPKILPGSKGVDISRNGQEQGKRERQVQVGKGAEPLVEGKGEGRVQVRKGAEALAKGKGRVHGSITTATAAIPDLSWLREPRSRAFAVLVLTARTWARLGISLVLYSTIPGLCGPSWPYSLRLVVRTMVAGCCVLLWMASIDDHWRSIYMGFFGLSVRNTQHLPLQATSVAEFWGRRWNREVHSLLKDGVYDPVVQALRAAPGLPQGLRRNIAVMATFAVSGLLHAHVYALLGNPPNFWLALGYFVAQPAGMFFERAAGVKAWPRPLARLWTVAFVAGTLPLLLEPMFWLLPPHAPLVLLGGAGAKAGIGGSGDIAGVSSSCACWW
ncbi:unnamed protein product [Discosporangium mesarthrocarpum]